MNGINKLNDDLNNNKQVQISNGSWFFTKEKRVKGIWYFVIPLVIGLFYAEWYKKPLSFNWPVFLLFSIVSLLTIALFDKKNRDYLSLIHRDIKIVLSTLLVVFGLVFLTITIDYPKFITEIFFMDEEDVKSLSYLGYLFAAIIYILWKSNDEN